MINPSEFMEVLKVIHCMSYGEVRKCLNVDSWPCKDEFDDLFNAMRKDLFHGLCNMDIINQELLVTYSMNKMHQARAGRAALRHTAGKETAND